MTPGTIRSGFRSAPRTGVILLGGILAGGWFVPGLPVAGQPPAAPRRPEAPPADGPKLAPKVKPFLSPVVEPYRKGTDFLQLPAGRKIEPAEVYADVPFALHVPFEIPAGGGPVLVYLHLNTAWDDYDLMVARGRKEVHPTQRLPRWDIGAHGLYRMDGKPIPDKTAFFPTTFESPDSWKPLTPYQAPGALPVLINAALPPKVETRPYAVNHVNGPAKVPPFQDESGYDKEGCPFVLTDARPGWYAFWFALQPNFKGAGGAAWPTDFRDRDVLKARLRASVVVARRDGPSGGEGPEFRYLYGLGPRPPRMTDERSLRATTDELPLAVRRDGWTFKEAAVRVRDKDVEKKRIDDGVTVVTLDAESGVTKEGARLKLVTSRTWKSADDMRERTEAEWDVRFPASLADNGTGDVLVGGRNEVELARGRTGPVFTWEWLDSRELHRPHGVDRVGPTTRVVYPGMDRKSFDEKGLPGEWWFEQPPAPPGKGGKPLRHRYWTDSDLNDRKRVLEAAGPFPLFSLDCGPWTVDGYYVRTKDVTEQRLAPVEPPPPTPPDTDDGYWAWLGDFHRLQDANRGRVAAIEHALAVQRAHGRATLRKWFTLMRLDAQDFDAKADLVDAGLGGRAGMSRLKLDDVREERKKVAEELNAVRPEQEKLIREGIRLLKEMVESPEVQAIRSGDRRPQLGKTIQHGRDELALGTLALYDAAGWHDREEMARAVADCQFESKASREVAALMRALAALARAEAVDRKVTLQMMAPARTGPNTDLENDAHAARVEAVRLLREVLSLNPRNGRARVHLRDLELRFVQLISAKLEREKKLNYSAFRAYLSARGYGTSDPDADPSGWWDGGKELASVWWGSGPITLGSGLPGWAAGPDTPGVIAGEVDLVQTTIAKHQVSLLAVRRLCRNGVSLDQIRRLKPEELAEKMAFDTAGRKPLDPARARRICQDIHETFAELYDLRALADGDDVEFWRHHRKGYYALIDSDKCWGESAGDFFFSPSGLLTWFGPGAVTRVDGRWAWGMASRAELAALEGAGRLERGRELFTTVVKLDELGRAIGGTRAGAALQAAVLADQRFLAEMYAGGKAREETVRHAVRWLSNSGSRLAATFLLYGGVSHLAEESGVPGLKQLTDALGALGVEEMAFDVLSRSGTPLRKLVTATERLAAHVAEEKAVLAEAGKSLDRLEAIAAGAKSAPAGAKSLDPESLKELESIGQKFAPKEPTVVVPGANRREDLHNTLTSAADAVKRGDAVEAETAMKAARRNAAEMQATLDAYETKCKEVLSFLNRHPPARAFDPQVPFPAIKDNRQPTSFRPPNGYAGGAHAEFLKFGDEALLRGEFDSALAFYRGSARHAETSAADVATQQMIGERLALARDAGECRRKFERFRQGTPPVRDALRPIGEPEAAALLQRLRDGTARFDGPVGSMNPVFHVREAAGGRAELMVFKLTAKEEEIAAELLSAAALEKLAAAAPGLGINAPACRRVEFTGQKVKYRKHEPETQPLIDHLTRQKIPFRPVVVEGEKYVSYEVEAEAKGLLFRYVRGTELVAHTEPQILAVKDEVARQTVYRLWLGDTDRHFRNQLLGADLHLTPIDFGFAHLKRDFAHRQFSPELVLGHYPRDQKEFMEAVAGFPAHVYTNHTKHPPLYGWVARVDEMLTYDDMGKAVEAVKELCKDGGAGLKDALGKTGLPAADVAEAVEVLVERAKHLEDVLKRYPRFKKSTARLHPRPRERWPDGRVGALAA